MKTKVLSTIFCIILIAGVHSADALDWSFSALPDNGVVSGVAGSTIGWGYTITNNDPSLWLVTAGLIPNGFANGTPNIIFDMPSIAPQQSMTINYDGTNGLCQFTWDVGTPVGTTNNGNFSLYAFYSATAYGDMVEGGTLLNKTAPFTATVSAAVAPEPSSATLVGAGLMALAGFALMARRNNRSARML